MGESVRYDSANEPNGGFWRSYWGLLRVAVVAPELRYSCDGDAGKIDVPSAQPGDGPCEHTVGQGDAKTECAPY